TTERNAPARPAWQLQLFGQYVHKSSKQIRRAFVLPKWAHDFQSPPVVGETKALAFKSAKQTRVCPPVDVVQDRWRTRFTRDGCGHGFSSQSPFPFNPTAPAEQEPVDLRLWTCTTAPVTIERITPPPGRLRTMKLGLINSAWAQAGKDTAYGIRMTKELGFDTIDIFADPLDMSIKERRLIQRECERAALPIISIACVAVGLIDFNPSVQRFHLQRCRAYLDLAYEYGAKNVLLVLGEYIWEKQVIPPAEQWQLGVNNCRELGKYAAD